MAPRPDRWAGRRQDPTGCLSTDILLNRLISSPDAGLRISRFCHVFLSMLPVLYTHLVVMYCRKRRYMPVILFCYGFGLCIAMVSHSPLYLTGMKHYSWGFFAQAGPAFAVYSAFGCVMFVFNIILYFKTVWKPLDPLSRKPLVLLISFGLGRVGLDHIRKHSGHVRG